MIEHIGRRDALRVRAAASGLAVIGLVTGLAACDTPLDEGEAVEVQQSALASVPCTNGAPVQTFGGEMYGCRGSVTFDNRATLCGPGFHVASASEWTTWKGGAPTANAPTHNYWTDDSLRFIAGPPCIAADKMPGGVWSSLGPPRVCVPGGTDSSGNTCNVGQSCGLDSTGPGFFFGMSPSGTPKAGALCVRSACANGDAAQSFAGGMVGCPGTSLFADRNTNVCANGYHVASAEEWVTYRKSATPTHNYWTWDNLSWAGSGPGNCAATFTPDGTADNCSGSPMRVCTPSGTDVEGNTCNWERCGLGTNQPDQSFGGCIGDTKAGALCVHSYNDACPAMRCPTQCAQSTQSCNFTLWPRLSTTTTQVVIPYEIVDPIIEDDFNLGKDAWNVKLSPHILFIKDATKSPRLRIVKSPNSAASCVIGATGNLTCSMPDGATVGGPAHELGHALGLMHEHVRGDRDRYVQVVTTYLGCSALDGNNWLKCGVDDQNSGMGVYDMTSTMHYIPNAPGGPIWKRGTMTPASGGMGAPSEQDASQVMEMYANQLGWKKAKSLSQDVGSFAPLRPQIPRPPASNGNVTIIGRPAVASQSATAALDTFVRGNDAHLYYSARTGVTGTYVDLGSGFTSDPAAASAGVNNLFVVAAQSGTLKVRKYNNGWSGTSWTSLPTPSPGMASGSSPAAVMWGTNILNVFIRNSNGGISFIQQTNGTWGSWSLVNPGGPSSPPGVTLTGSPTVASQGTGEFNIYVNSSTGAIWSTWLGVAFGWQNAWRNELCCADAGTSPAATSWAPGRVDLFFSQGKNLMWRYATNQWFGTFRLGGLIEQPASNGPKTSPAAVGRATNRISVLTRGTDHGLWLRQYQP
jgi:hypothetical protein